MYAIRDAVTGQMIESLRTRDQWREIRQLAIEEHWRRFSAIHAARASLAGKLAREHPMRRPHQGHLTA